MLGSKGVTSGPISANDESPMTTARPNTAPGVLLNRRAAALWSGPVMKGGTPSPLALEELARQLDERARILLVRRVACVHDLELGSEDLAHEPRRVGRREQLVLPPPDDERGRGHPRKAR